ncbi:hypothetical protein AB3N02_29500 [Priestia aryabhattai]|jgi:hypothetical protein|uniref:hypothetical protein n=1 Tax=Priestia aryabhattai TaxID=412384 RepID=UPI0039A2A821
MIDSFYRTNVRKCIIRWSVLQGWSPFLLRVIPARSFGLLFSFLLQTLYYRSRSLENLITEELEELIGLDKVGSIQASAGDETVIREEGDVFADWYREELIRIIKENQ